jgi:lysozyme family protein
MGDLEERIERLAAQATQLGLDRALIAAIKGPADYDRLLPVLTELGDLSSTARAGPGGGSEQLTQEADALLLELLNSERSKASASDDEPAARGGEAAFATLAPEYETLFQSCAVPPGRADTVAWHVDRLLQGRPVYEEVGAGLGIPWYFIGIVHGLEASFRFGGHLHNGDPLRRRTVNVPSGRPLVWDPPNDWSSSARDALTFEGFVGLSDWSLPRMLHRWESYNGFGSRRHGIHSPYLWSFSNHYSKGKYARDGVWDPDLVSKQCGAGVMLKALSDQGIISVS